MPRQPRSLLDSGQTTCSRCGRICMIEGFSSYCDMCHRAMNDELIRRMIDDRHDCCPHCGLRQAWATNWLVVKDGDAYCGHCGEAIEYEDMQYPPCRP